MRTHLIAPCLNKGRYNRLMKTLGNSLAAANSDVAAFRLKVIEHGGTYGWKSACNAFEVSKASYFRWKKKYLSSRKSLVSLVPEKTRPKKVRVMTTDYRLVEFIRKIREQFGNIGREKIKIFLDEYARELEIESISARTIGKIIKRRNLFDHPIRKKVKKKADRIRAKKSPRIVNPGLVEVDCVTINVLNRRYYFVCCLEVFTRLAGVKLVKTLSSKNATTTLANFLAWLPFPIHTVQTDNGSEFLLHFDQSIFRLKTSLICLLIPAVPKSMAM